MKKKNLVFVCVQNISLSLIFLSFECVRIVLKDSRLKMLCYPSVYNGVKKKHRNIFFMVRPMVFPYNSFQT